MSPLSRGQCSPSEISWQDSSLKTPGHQGLWICWWSSIFNIYINIVRDCVNNPSDFAQNWSPSQPSLKTSASSADMGVYTPPGASFLSKQKHALPTQKGITGITNPTRLRFLKNVSFWWLFLPRVVVLPMFYLPLEPRFNHQLLCPFSVSA